MARDSAQSRAAFWVVLTLPNSMNGLEQSHNERLKKDLASFTEDNESHPQLRVKYA